MGMLLDLLKGVQIPGSGNRFWNWASKLSEKLETGGGGADVLTFGGVMHRDYSDPVYNPGFLWPGGSGISSSVASFYEMSCIAAKSGTLRNFFLVNYSGGAPGGTGLLDSVTVRVNGVDTGLSILNVAPPSGDHDIYSQTSSEASVVAGDLISVRFVSNSGTPYAANGRLPFMNASVELVSGG